MATVGSAKPMGLILRELIASPDILIAPGVFDGFSLGLVEQHGFAAALVTGAGVSESRYGFPDVGLIGIGEALDAVRSLARMSSVPLIADGDTGYGNAVNVYYAVKEFERAGVAGMMLEDQTWPKRCGHMAGKEVIAAEEMVGKIEAAVLARSDPSFVIKARTDAAAEFGVAEAVRRANLYAEAGADLLFADALLTKRDVETFCHGVSKPVAVNMGFGIRSRATTPLISPKELERLGVAVVVYPRMLTAGSVQGMTNAIRAFNETRVHNRVTERADLVASFDEINELVGIQEIHALESRFTVKKADVGPGRRSRMGSK